MQNTTNAEKVLALNEAGLIALLKNAGSTEFEKAKACQRLAVVGTKAAVPALAALLTDAKFSHYARFGLEPIPDAAADDALRNALGKVTGAMRAGVINSLAVRKDAKSVAAIGKHLRDTDVEVADAAVAAVGRIGGAQAQKTLLAEIKRTKGPVRPVLADACLVCAEKLDAKQAAELRGALAKADVTKLVRKLCESPR